MQEKENDIYRLNKRFDYEMRKLDASNALEENKQDIKRFLKEIELIDHVSRGRVMVYAPRIRHIAEVVKKPFRECTQDDLKDLVMEISERKWRNRITGKGADGITKTYYEGVEHPIAEETRRLYLVCIKRFWKWLYSLNGRDYPEVVKFIKTGSKSVSTTLPESILSVDEVNAIIDCCQNLRDKALVSVLAESGTRIGELAPLRVRDITFDGKGGLLRASGKTGTRLVRIIGVKHLLNWLEAHPLKQNPEAFVWVNLTTAKNEPMRYEAIAKLLKVAAKRAGVTKRIHAHGFRHYSATMAKKLYKLDNFVMESRYGWKHGSKMVGVYANLSQADVDDAYLGARGIQPTQQSATTITCPRCHESSKAGSQHCGKCGMVLDSRVAFGMEQQQAKDQLDFGKLVRILSRRPDLRQQIALEWVKERENSST